MRGYPFRLISCGFILAGLPAAVRGQTAASPTLGPDPAGELLLPEEALPEYEIDLDHRSLIQDVDRAVINRGQGVYQRVCQNCHGDQLNAGSMPNAMRFAEGSFARGADPLSIYETITRGWRLMPPQVQLTPIEKYAVIAYIRRAFLEAENPDQLFEITEEYLESIPSGSHTGPVPADKEPWKEMDYGPFLIGTFEITTPEERENPQPAEAPRDYVGPSANIPAKAIAIRLDPGEGGVSRGHTWLAFEHDTLRVAAVWTGDDFIDYHGINFDGQHVVRPRTGGRVVFETADQPGWAHPVTGEFSDGRFEGLDGRRYGPLPRDHARYRGLYRHGDRVVVSYEVGGVGVLESHRLGIDGAVIRSLQLEPSPRPLRLRVADAQTQVTTFGQDEGVEVSREGGFVVATIPPQSSARRLSFVLGGSGTSVPSGTESPDLLAFTQGGPTQWSESVQTPLLRGEQAGVFQWDEIVLPANNPWASRLRTSGFDFGADGRTIYVCFWDGDVWRGELPDSSSAGRISWRRIAAGLFQPLGLKIVDGDVYVSCRDQIVVLRDLNGDGETDFHECFNSDHQVTEHFHEFAMGLQVDEAGNFYYAKSARHARPPIVEQHGTLLKVSADGSSTEILAHGFRAANGVCLNPDGTFYVTDQEGHWNPMNRINKVTADNRFYGNMWGYGAPESTADDAMEKPVCWVDKRFNRSPSELVWLDSDAWGPLSGRLLNLSYGFGRMELVMEETLNGQPQAGLVRLPIPDFPTGTMRGRMNPHDDHLYVGGLAAWGTSQTTQAGGLYRIRYRPAPLNMPIDLRVRADGLEITFGAPIDPASLRRIPDAFSISTWALRRSADYGSEHYDQNDVKVADLILEPDGHTVRIVTEPLAPVWQMAIRFDLRNTSGEPVTGEIQNTIHQVP